jgi:predicted ATP-grasp superfamily ATP-dependent carboligase
MTNKNQGRVLVFGDDMRIFLAVVRSLGRAGLEVHAAPFDAKSPALKSKYIKKIHRFPRYSSDPKGWLAEVLAVLRSEPFDLVVPCSDNAILPLDLNRHYLAQYRLAIPSARAMEFLFDKELTRQLCDELGIPVVDGKRINIGDSAKELVKRFGLPIVIKPRRSYWTDRLDQWGKVSILDSELEVQAALDGLDEPWRYLAEGYFEGTGTGVSVLAKDGKILQAFQHRRLREGRGGNSSYRVSEPTHPELLQAAEKICTRMNMTGVCMFEFRFNDESRKWILIETNCRFWGSLPLPVSLGVDFPRYLYDLMVHDKQPVAVDYRTGIKARNFTLDGYNLLKRLRGLKRGERGGWLKDLGSFATQPLRWMTGRERSDSFVSDDLKPAFSECAALLRNATQTMGRLKEKKPRQSESQTANGEISRALIRS